MSELPFWERKSLSEIEAHLVSEDGKRANTGAIGFLHAFGEESFQQIVILAHPLGLARKNRVGGTV